MAPKLYFRHLTLCDNDGGTYVFKNIEVTRAIKEINQIIQTRGDGTTEIVIREVGQ
ncbi:MAG: hypothetical protein PHQ24_10440 [Proteiniphilum sp.]|nr:hypothetical protein [Proteiniphilum sp.]